jgi:5-methylcytosine-specific restriction enzyme A
MPKSIPFSRAPRLNGPREARPESKSERDKFYSGADWRDLREVFLRQNPLCARCTSEGRTTLASLVHHIKERIPHPELAFDWDNLESSCNPCHTRRHKERSQPTRKVR